MDALSLTAIRKRFPLTGTQALDGADFSLRPGEVHALVGENGAGKSTLARIASGLLEPDSGAIMVRGKPARFRSHRDAERAGIGLVPQESLLADGLTVAQNLALGREPRRFGIFYDHGRAVYETELLLDAYGVANTRGDSGGSEKGFTVDPDALVGDLGPSQRREAEILRAMARGSSVLILDEPTSILSEDEAQRLFSLLRRLKAAGTGVIYISHRAKEILSVADRISVLREGRTVATVEASSLDECELAELIVKASACPAGPDRPKQPGRPVLELSGGSINFCVRSGEVVGIAAIQGNALDRLEAMCAGLMNPPSGSVSFQGQPFYPRRDELVRSGRLAYLPTDRDGLALSTRSSARDNILARSLGCFGVLDYAKGAPAQAAAQALAAKWQVRGELGSPAAAMSGGNRQRLVAARELDGHPELVVAANPAQGLDPEARQFLWQRLAQARDGGAAVLLLSHDPADLAEMADRAFILYRGRLVELKPGDLDGPSLSALLTGAGA